MRRFQRLLRDARGALEPGERTPESVLAAVAMQCGEADVADIVECLDELVREESRLPASDGDAADAIFLAQQELVELLGRVPDPAAETVRKGLDSPELQTRQWISFALERPF